MRGNAFVELYYTYTMLDEGEKWYVNAEVMKWMENRFDVLQHSQRFGKDPKDGEVYGYSAWNSEKGTVSIRNPSGEVKKYSIKLDRDIGVPENIQTTYRKTILSHKTVEGLQEGRETNYGETIEVTLQPGEHRIIDFEPTKDTKEPEIEVMRSISANEILIRFNKRIVPDIRNYEIEGLEIKEISLKADLKTIILRTAAMKKNTNYSIKLKEVSDSLGNKLTTTLDLHYVSNNAFVFIPNEIQGNDDIISDIQYESDSFSFVLSIKDRANVKNSKLIEDEGNNFAVEIVDDRLKFSFGSLSVTTAENLPAANFNVTLVRERNTMIKIYVNGLISNSSYDKESSPLMKVKDIKLCKSEVTFSSIYMLNYGLGYKDHLKFDEEESNKVYVISGCVIGGVALVAIVVLVAVVYIRRKKIRWNWSDTTLDTRF